jgi:hypothetical protein
MRLYKECGISQNNPTITYPVREAGEPKAGKQQFETVREDFIGEFLLCYGNLQSFEVITVVELR